MVDAQGYIHALLFTFVAVNGAKPPFPLCLQLAYSESSGCIEDSLVPGPAPLQDAAWEAVQRRDGAALAGGRHPHLPTRDLCLREGRIAWAKVPLRSCKDPKWALSNPPLIACNVPNQSGNWICLI